MRWPFLFSQSLLVAAIPTTQAAEARCKWKLSLQIRPLAVPICQNGHFGRKIRLNLYKFPKCDLSRQCWLVGFKSGFLMHINLLEWRILGLNESIVRLLPSQLAANWKSSTNIILQQYLIYTTCQDKNMKGDIFSPGIHQKSNSQTSASRSAHQRESSAPDNTNNIYIFMFFMFFKVGKLMVRLTSISQEDLKMAGGSHLTRPLW